ncbi:MAG: metal ABC transporter substrate-binding protein [Lachnospiraceae bacterium]|nr:metal ABC transporter substrate-binding protein [Lachnospiraceae bacterium]
MFKTKKAIALVIALIYIIGCLSGCSSDAKDKATGSDSKKLQIVTTIFPEYDWVQSILGDNPGKAEVTLLLDNGVDLHSYQPTASDILKISSCDMFIYVGGESDGWVEDTIKTASNKNMSVINLLESLGDSVKEEEMVEGMQESAHNHDHDHDHDEDEDHDHDHDHDEDEDHDHDHDEGEDHDHDEDEDHDHDEDEDHDHEHEHHHEHEEGEVEYDEHVWLSLRNTSSLVMTISKSLQKLDPENASTYKKNTDAYIEKLNKLDADYKAAVDAASVKTVLFGDRFPFRYLVDDYGLKYYAAFVGCSAETEASFETISFLAGKVDELSLHSVFTIEKSDQKIAKTIVSNSKSKDQSILTLDSLQSTTSEDIKNGTTYLSVMENNLNVLKVALK